MSDLTSFFNHVASARAASRERTSARPPLAPARAPTPAPVVAIPAHRQQPTGGPPWEKGRYPATFAGRPAGSKDKLPARRLAHATLLAAIEAANPNVAEMSRSMSTLDVLKRFVSTVTLNRITAKLVNRSVTSAEASQEFIAASNKSRTTWSHTNKYTPLVQNTVRIISDVVGITDASPEAARVVTPATLSLKPNLVEHVTEETPAPSVEAGTVKLTKQPPATLSLPAVKRKYKLTPAPSPKTFPTTPQDPIEISVPPLPTHPPVSPPNSTQISILDTNPMFFTTTSTFPKPL